MVRENINRNKSRGSVCERDAIGASGRAAPQISSFVSHHATGKKISQQPCTRLVKRYENLMVRSFSGNKEV
jgi:hypothetical protein